MDKIIEVGLEISNTNFFNRALKTLKRYLLFVPFAILLYFFLKGYNQYLIPAIIFVLMLLIAYSIILNFKILYKVKYYVESDMIQIITVRFNHMNQELFFKRTELEVSVRESFRYRYPLWQIKFYHKKNIVVSQLALNGWTQQMFLEIEGIIKKV